jgi:hypothetical protein
MTSYRAAGISFVRFANIAAVALRQSLKEPFKSNLAIRNKQQVLLNTWSGGKPTLVKKYVANHHRTTQRHVAAATCTASVSLTDTTVTALATQPSKPLNDC